MGSSSSTSTSTSPTSPQPPTSTSTSTSTASTPKHPLKFVTLGAAQTGKSSLMARLTGSPFSKSISATIGAGFLTKTIDLSRVASGDRELSKRDSPAVDLQIWDTAGQARYNSLLPMYYRSADGLVLTFDITSRSTFLFLQNKEMQSALATVPACVLVGCKADLAADREVSFEEAEAFAAKLDLHYYELSAKGAEAGTKIEETLEELAYRALTGRLYRRDYSFFLLALRDSDSNLRHFTSDYLYEPWLVKDILSFLAPSFPTLPTPAPSITATHSNTLPQNSHHHPHTHTPTQPLNHFLPPT